MGFNSAFKGLNNCNIQGTVLQIEYLNKKNNEINWKVKVRA